MILYKTDTTDYPGIEELHCMSFGNTVLTFDGLMYDFNGGCTYNLASDSVYNWQVQVQSIDCDRLSTCIKVC